MSARTSARLPHLRRPGQRSLAGLLAGALAVSGATIVLGSAGPASAAPTSPTPVCSATTATCTVTYDYTGSLQTFTVPASVTSVVLDLYGAQAGKHPYYSSAPGLGGHTVGALGVEPGQDLSLLVGQAGAVGGGTGTYGGGGPSGWNNGQAYLASGGGGSFVFTAGGDLLAAAGGGGGGGDGLAGGAGGGATGSGADGGVESFWASYGDTPARGGSQAAGGGGGRNQSHAAFGAAGSGPAANGVPGGGGAGGYSPYNTYFSGAGGGGGYYGGGGGGAFHGGGGGSGYAAPSLTSVSGQSGVQAGNGRLVVSYDRPSAEVSLQVSPSSTTVGDSLMLKATVTSTLVTPTNTVTFTDDGATIPGCSSVPLGSGHDAVCVTAGLDPGTHSLGATYVGDGVLAPTTSLVSHRVNYEPLEITTTSLPSGTYGDSYSSQLAAQDGHGEYTWSVADGSSLPAGLGLSTSGLLSGTLAAAGDASFTLEVRDGQDEPFTDTRTFDLAVAKAAQTVTFDSTSPTGGRVGQTWDPVTSGQGTGEALYVVGAGTTDDACSISGPTVRFDHVGTCEVAATRGADSNHEAGSSSYSVGVEAKATQVVVTMSDESVAYGHPVTASATASAAGTLQWAVAGTDVGGPVAVTPGSPVDAPALYSSLPDAGAYYEVTATFVPDDATVDGATVGRDGFSVGAAESELQLAVTQDALVATVGNSVVGDGGVPTGEVTFLVDDEEIGTASLVAPSTTTLVLGLLPATAAVATFDRVMPAGAGHHVTAVYDGDDNFTGASDSTERDDPSLTAEATSSRAPRNGWYRTPVTVTFTCTPAGAALVGPCPAPVVVSRSGAGQTVSRTILAEDGGAATASVTGIDVDRVAPTVRVAGKGRTARCAAIDSLSGVARCTLTRTRSNGRMRLVATAVDRAGNVSTTSPRSRSGIDVVGAPLVRGRHVVSAGARYSVVVWAQHRPRLLAAVPAGDRLGGAGVAFRGAGRGRWLATVLVPRNAAGDWKLGVRTQGRGGGRSALRAPMSCLACSDPCAVEPLVSATARPRTGQGGCEMALEIDWFFQRADWLHLLTVPVFTGVVGFLINWTGLIMLFSPVRFRGVTVPGMRQLSRVLPRKIQEVPGILQGGLGWQGIVPARAAKMGSIAVDKAIAKLGTPQGVLPAARARPDRRAHRHRLPARTCRR